MLREPVGARRFQSDLSHVPVAPMVPIGVWRIGQVWYDNVARTRRLSHSRGRLAKSQAGSVKTKEEARRKTNKSASVNSQGFKNPNPKCPVFRFSIFPLLCPIFGLCRRPALSQPNKEARMMTSEPELSLEIIRQPQVYLVGRQTVDDASTRRLPRRPRRLHVDDRHRTLPAKSSSRSPDGSVI